MNASDPVVVGPALVAEAAENNLCSVAVAAKTVVAVVTVVAVNGTGRLRIFDYYFCSLPGELVVDWMGEILFVGAARNL